VSYLPCYSGVVVCSLLRQGMDNLLVSLDGPEAHALEERATRDNLPNNVVEEVGSLLFCCNYQRNVRHATERMNEFVVDLKLYTG
jgi:hypothetical protein